ncbi:type II secretion system GspH family protein [Patescibacteria group bacterium]|nr:type II secretion system GspH family protein [Patescibacteria group bacterium]
MRKNQRGFSLVEILIVLAIIGLILTVFVFALNANQKDVRDLKRAGDIQSLRTAMALLKNETGFYERAYCDLGAVNLCSQKQDSEMARFIPQLQTMVDPSGSLTSCADKAACESSDCNYTFTKMEIDDYEIRFHLERGVDDLPVPGCYAATPIGIVKL